MSRYVMTRQEWAAHYQNEAKVRAQAASFVDSAEAKCLFQLRARELAAYAMYHLGVVDKRHMRRYFKCVPTTHWK